LLGYRWDSGLSLTLFGEGTQKDKHDVWNRQWLQGGLRLDLAFGRHSTRWGPGNFYAGAGASYFSLNYERQGGEYYWEPQPSKVKAKGTATVAALGYQIVNQSGVGFNAAVTGSSGRFNKMEYDDGAECGFNYEYYNKCTDPQKFETAALTVGLSYVL
jgi:hypothetical protein